MHGMSKATNLCAPWKLVSRVENLVFKDAAVFKTQMCAATMQAEQALSPYGGNEYFIKGLI
jgi:hypothetical protein